MVGEGELRKATAAAAKVGGGAVCAKRKLRVEKGGQRAKRVGAISCEGSEKTSLVGTNICAGVLKAVRN